MELTKRIQNAYSALRGNPLEAINTPLGVGINSILAWGTQAEPTPSGEIIDEKLAEQFIQVWSAIRIISESVSGLPLLTFKREGAGRKEAINDPVHQMLSLRPNPYMTAVTFWETIVHNMALTGNGYALIGRNKNGQPIEVYPLHPFTVKMVMSKGEIAYEVRNQAQTTIFQAKDILHFPLMSWDGLKGESPIHKCRSTIGLAKAIEKHASRFFGNGSQPTGGILTTKEGIKVKDQDFVNMRQFWEQANGGENRSRVTILPPEWVWQSGTSATDNKDSQMIEARAAIRAEIGAAFRLPPHMLGDTSRLSNNNVEQQNLSFVRDTLKPYTIKIEQECNWKLLQDSPSMFVQFDFTELQRGDSETLTKVFIAGRQWGILTGNECREQIGKNPAGPEGDLLWAPVNMQDAARLLDTESTLEAPAPQEPNDQVIPDTLQDEDQNSARLKADHRASFAPMFRDAVGRLVNRSNRKAEDVKVIFTPVIDGITEIINRDVSRQFNLDSNWQPESCTKDILKSIEKKSQNWTADEVEAISKEELIRAIRTIQIQQSRDAGAYIAMNDFREAA